MDEEELLAAIADEVQWASERRDARAASGGEAIEYFYANLPGPPTGTDAECGMSDLVSTDVQDAVYAVCAEIMPAFSGAAPVEFQALDESDAPMADLETRAVNHVAQSAGVYMALANAVQDAMLRRAGVVKVFWEERVDVRYETLEDVRLDMLPQALAEQPDQTTEIISGDLDEQAGTASVTLRRHRKRGRPRIDAVPLDEFLISADLATPSAEEARFLAHQRAVSRSELIELGMDPALVAELDKYESTGMARARTARDAELRSAHASTEYVMCVESYYNVDWDGDGIAERRRVITAGGGDGTDKLLLNDPWFEQPFAVGVGYLGVYTWDGVSLFDRLKAIQDAKTSLLRDMVNGTKRNMKQRLGVIEGDANMADVMTSAAGGLIRMKSPNGLVPVPDVQLPPVVFQVLEYLDGVRKDKGGGAIDATASAQVLGQGGDWSLERIMAATEQLNAMVAKTLVETLVKPVYRKLHALLREYQAKPLSVPGSAGWQATMPAQWQPREEMVTTMGMSVGERTQRMGALQQVAMTHAADMQVGMVDILSNAQSVYRARLDMARLAGLPQPEQYFIDPDSPQAQQAVQAKAQQAQAAQAAMEKDKILTAEVQYRLMTDVEKIKADAKITAQQMAEQTRQMMAKLDTMAKLLGHKVKLAEVEQATNPAGAQMEIDRLQYETALEAGSANEDVRMAAILREVTKAKAEQGTHPPSIIKPPAPMPEGPQGPQGQPGGPGGMPQPPMAQGAPQGPPQGPPPQAPPTRQG